MTLRSPRARASAHGNRVKVDIDIDHGGHRDFSADPLWLAVVQPQGPDGEVEPTGARYWVRRYNVGGDDEDPGGYDTEVQLDVHEPFLQPERRGQTGKLSAQPFIEPFYVTATNLAELSARFVENANRGDRWEFNQPDKSTHELVSGMVVEVREVARLTLVNTVRQFVFHKEPDRSPRLAKLRGAPREERDGANTDSVLCDVFDWPFPGLTEKGENDAGVRVHAFMYPGAGGHVEGIGNAYPMVNDGSWIQVSRYTSKLPDEDEPSVKWHCLYPFQIASDECRDGGV